MQQTERVRFVHPKSMTLGFNVKFIKRSVGCSRNKAFPNSRRAAGGETVRLRIPAVKTADH